MGRWKVAGAVLLAVGGATALTVFGAAVRGQERPERAPRAAREFHLAQWPGSQIGVTVRDGESATGVIVDDIRRDSPAAKAGVKEGDVITEFDGERVRSSRQFARLVDETPRGRSVKMTLQRDGQRTTVDVAPEPRPFGRVMPIPMERFEWPEPPEIAPAPRLPRDFDRWVAPEIEVFSSRGGRLGVQVEDLEDQLAEYFGVKRGVLVTSVSKDSPAARAGIKAGDVITKIGEEAVEDTADVRREIRRMDADKEFAIEITRDRKPVTVKAKLDPPSSGRRSGTPTEWF